MQCANGPDEDIVPRRGFFFLPLGGISAADPGSSLKHDFIDQEGIAIPSITKER
ncbi:MAG: hypothetical protein Q4C81_04170 [Kocuria sp.]|nr:hypothetical protein [Kocuria sp.]